MCAGIRIPWRAQPIFLAFAQRHRAADRQAPPARPDTRQLGSARRPLTAGKYLFMLRTGAGERIRTVDPNLGKRQNMLSPQCVIINSNAPKYAVRRGRAGAAPCTGAHLSGLA